jgi:hypothetical protein
VNSGQTRLGSGQDTTFGSRLLRYVNAAARHPSKLVRSVESAASPLMDSLSACLLTATTKRRKYPFSETIGY